MEYTFYSTARNNIFSLSHLFDLVHFGTVTNKNTIFISVCDSITFLFLLLGNKLDKVLNILKAEFYNFYSIELKYTISKKGLLIKLDKVIKSPGVEMDYINVEIKVRYVPFSTFEIFKNYVQNYHKPEIITKTMEVWFFASRWNFEKGSHIIENIYKFDVDPKTFELVGFHKTIMNKTHVMFSIHSITTSIIYVYQREIELYKNINWKEFVLKEKDGKFYFFYQPSVYYDEPTMNIQWKPPFDKIVAVRFWGLNNKMNLIKMICGKNRKLLYKKDTVWCNEDKKHFHFTYMSIIVPLENGMELMFMFPDVAREEKLIEMIEYAPFWDLKKDLYDKHVAVKFKQVYIPAFSKKFYEPREFYEAGEFYESRKMYTVNQKGIYNYEGGIHEIKNMQFPFVDPDLNNRNIFVLDKPFVCLRISGKGSILWDYAIVTEPHNPFKSKAQRRLFFARAGGYRGKGRKRGKRSTKWMRRAKKWQRETPKGRKKKRGRKRKRSKTREKFGGLDNQIKISPKVKMEKKKCPHPMKFPEGYKKYSEGAFGEIFISNKNPNRIAKAIKKITTCEMAREEFEDHKKTYDSYIKNKHPSIKIPEPYVFCNLIKTATGYGCVYEMERLYSVRKDGFQEHLIFNEYYEHKDKFIGRNPNLPISETNMKIGYMRSLNGAILEYGLDKTLEMIRAMGRLFYIFLIESNLSIDDVEFLLVDDIEKITTVAAIDFGRVNEFLAEEEEDPEFILNKLMSMVASANVYIPSSVVHLAYHLVFVKGFIKASITGWKDFDKRKKKIIEYGYIDLISDVYESSIASYLEEEEVEKLKNIKIDKKSVLLYDLLIGHKKELIDEAEKGEKSNIMFHFEYLINLSFPEIKIIVADFYLILLSD